MATENTVATTNTNEAVLTDDQRAATFAKYEAFRLPEPTDGDFSMEELSEEMAGIHLSLPRVKIPSGGSVFFEIPGENSDDPKVEKVLEGIIVFNHDAQAYWENGKADGDDNASPNCSSVDGITGVGTPGGACALCPMNAWGSGKGKSKACKRMRNLYLLLEGDYMPTLVSLPPTSLQPFNAFVSSEFATRRRAVYGSIVQIGLRKMNNGKDDYSVATFKRVYNFTGEKLEEVRRYVKEVKEQIQVMLTQQAIEAEARTFADVDDDTATIEGAFSATAALLGKPSGVADDLPD